MGLNTLCDEVRAEAEAVLLSGIFERAPNLESFFRYICERHFCGQAEQLNQYSIAVEALGRPSHFDQKKDSIVRVEANRLRKRLSEYYQGEGSGHKIHISIPPGGYAPQFVSFERPSAALEPSQNTPLRIEASKERHTEPVIEQPRPFQFPLPSRRVASFLAVLAAAAVFGLVKWPVLSGGNATAEFGHEIWKSVPGEIVPAEFRMLAGYHGKTFSDVQGRDWHPDAYYSGGRSTMLTTNLVIEGLPASGFVKSERTGRFRYDIPVREGLYEIHLYFVETEYGIGNRKGGGDGSRLFRLAINGVSQIDIFDVHAEAGGPNRLFVRVFKDISRASDGKIHIAFEPLTGMALVNAIEILPSAAGRIRPIRIVAQDHSVTDSDGHVWFADEFVVGGTQVLRRNTLFHDRNCALYQGERFGNFTYHLPLAPGKYRLTLHFAETWFGTPSAVGNRQEHRLFNLYANGEALLRNFDILREAGGPNRGIAEVFEGLEPNAQGELALQFVPVANYAEVNAIEVVETE